MAETRESVMDFLLLIHLNFFAKANEMAMSDSDFNEQKYYRWTWIGLNDPNSDDIWVWLDEEDQAAWTNWMDGQPGENFQDCVVLDAAYSGEWRDLECEYDYSWSGESFICEIPALTTTIATTTTTMTTPTAVTTVTTPATSTSLATTSTTTSSLVEAREASSGGLSVAAIAGIVAGVLVVAALVPAAFFTIRYFKNRQRNDHSVAYTTFNGAGNREAIVTVG